MGEIDHFGLVVLVVAAALAFALLSTRLTSRLPIPGPAIFLLAAAIASDIFPSLEHVLSVRTVARVGVVALVVILFDGGLHLGWRRVSPVALPVLALGIPGTFATAAIIAAAAHVLFGFSWTAAGVLGAALAPTDPAVLFSVLGNREIGGRAGSILKSEAGANDPVGIALMIGMIEFATHAHASPWVIVRDFATQMSIGFAIGVAAGLAAVALLRTEMPGEGFYPLRALAIAGTIYGVGTAAHGSGFLAVFVAGLIVGDANVRAQEPIGQFLTPLASLAEILVFLALGLSIDLTSLGDHLLWAKGLALAAILILVARPFVTAPLLVLPSIRVREYGFLAWGGLKGAVPILLTALAVVEGVPGARDLYGIVFVVVMVSVLVQGTTIPMLADRLHVPIQDADD